MNQILVVGKVHVEVKLVASSLTWSLELEHVEKARLPGYPVAVKLGHRIFTLPYLTFI